MINRKYSWIFSKLFIQHNEKYIKKGKFTLFSPCIQNFAIPYFSPHITVRPIEQLSEVSIRSTET